MEAWPAADSTPTQSTRREFVKHSGVLTASALMGLVPAGVRQGAWAAGTDAPEREAVRVGFLPLTDCASLVVAATEGFDRKHGLRIALSKRASWASVRDGLVNGDLDAAHALYGLIYGTELGIGGLQHDMAALMTLNRNGQAITLSNRLRDRHIVDGAGLAKAVAARDREHVFAQTFPTGTHALWLYYWLAAHGVYPMGDVVSTVVAPPRTVEALKEGKVDGFCAGEPWNAIAVREKVGFTAATSQEIWPDHPEKVLGATAEFVREFPNTARALVAAILEASRFIETAANRDRVAQLIADPAYVDVNAAAIAGRFAGDYEDGLGRRWRDRHAISFHADGAVNYPWLSDGMWFMTQHRRWGMLRADPDYRAVAARVNRIDVYRDAAAAVGVAVPEETTRKSTLIDGVAWDGSDPAKYASSFAQRFA